MRIQGRFMASAVFMLAAIGGNALAQQAPPSPDKVVPKPGDVITFERHIEGPHRT